jgi:hypothetical protein
MLTDPIRCAGGCGQPIHPHRVLCPFCLALVHTDPLPYAARTELLSEVTRVRP